MALKIEIPVHHDPEWTTGRSPDELPVRTRLQASTSASKSKSPEALTKSLAYATLLRQAHIDAIQARAARSSALAKEAQARRLRQEAAARQRLVAQFDSIAKRDERLSAEKAKAAVERVARREQLQSAVKEAREAREQARQQRGSFEHDRCTDASAKRDKSIQATIDKNAYQVKRALAVATAVKEMERETAAAAAEKLDASLAAATERRYGVCEGKQGEASSRAATGARHVVITRHEQDLSLAGKRQASAAAMDAALARHAETVAATQAAAALANARVDAAAERKAATAAAAEAARRAHFEKMNDAAVRRATAALPTRGRGFHPEPIVIDVATFAPAGYKAGERHSPSEGLLARLSARPSPLMRAHRASERQLRAAEHLKLVATARASSAALHGLRDGAAARRRALAYEAMAARAQTRFECNVRNGSAALAARVAVTRRFNARVAAAAARRGRADAAARRKAVRSALRRQLAVGYRAATLLARESSRAGRVRQLEAASNRGAADLKRFERGRELHIKEAAAAASRAVMLSRRVAKLGETMLRKAQPGELAVVGVGVSRNRSEAVLTPGILSAPADETADKTVEKTTDKAVDETANNGASAELASREAKPRDAGFGVLGATSLGVALVAGAVAALSLGRV